MDSSTLSDNWFLITSAVALVMGWARFEFEIRRAKSEKKIHDVKIDGLEKRIDLEVSKIADYKNDVTKVKTDVEWIRDMLDKLGTKIDNYLIKKP